MINHHPPSSHQAISEFRREIKHLRQQRSNAIRPNSGSILAAVVLAEIFASSINVGKSHTIRIFAKSLDGSISSQADYLWKMHEFVKAPGNKLKVITEKYPPQQDALNAFELIQVFLREPELKNKVELYEVKEGALDDVRWGVERVITEFLRFVPDFLKKENPPAYKYFAISDAGLYRFEYDNMNHEADYCMYTGLLDPIEEFFDKIIENNEVIPFSNELTHDSADSQSSLRNNEYAK